MSKDLTEFQKYSIEIWKSECKKTGKSFHEDDRDFSIIVKEKILELFKDKILNISCNHFFGFMIINFVFNEILYFELKFDERELFKIIKNDKMFKTIMQNQISNELCKTMFK